jgi:hypothetical protein
MKMQKVIRGGVVRVKYTYSPPKDLPVLRKRFPDVEPWDDAALIEAEIARRYPELVKSEDAS